jgi:hypothetical protein
MKTKAKDIKQHADTEIEKAKDMAKNSGKISPPKPKDSATLKPEQGNKSEKAQTQEAQDANPSKKMPNEPNQPDMGEPLSDDNYEREVSADRVLAAGDVGDTLEGVDEANADSELDDVAVEDEDDGVAN